MWIKKKSLSHFCYLLLKGKSLNPAYPPEGYEVKTHKQWRFWCFITKEKRRNGHGCSSFSKVGYFYFYFLIHLFYELRHILRRSIKASCHAAKVRQRSVQSQSADFDSLMHMATSYTCS